MPGGLCRRLLAVYVLAAVVFAGGVIHEPVMEQCSTDDLRVQPRQPIGMIQLSALLLSAGLSPGWA